MILLLNTTFLSETAKVASLFVVLLFVLFCQSPKNRPENCLSRHCGNEDTVNFKENKRHVNLSLRKKYTCEDEPGSGHSSL